MFDCIGDFALLGEQIAKVVVKRKKISADPQGVSKNGLGLVETAQSAQHGSQVVPGTQMPGRQFNGPPVACFRIFQTPLLHINVAQVVVSVHIIRRYIQGPGNGLDGFISAAALVVKHT